MKILTRNRFVYLPTVAMLFCGNLEAQQSDLYATWKPFDQYTRHFSPEESNKKMSQLKTAAKDDVASFKKLQKYENECEKAKKNSDSFYFAGIRAKNIRTFAISRNRLRIEYYNESKKGREQRIQEIMRADPDPNLTRQKAEKMVDAEVHIPKNLRVLNCEIRDDRWWQHNYFQASCLGRRDDFGLSPDTVFYFEPPKQNQLVIRIRRTRDANQDVFIAMER
jgi:hypothetical protein